MNEALAGVSLALLVLGASFRSTPLLILSAALLLLHLTDTPLKGLLLKAVSGLATIISSVALALIFFLILTPLALIRRIFDRNLLWLRKPAAPTYWKVRDKEMAPADMEEVW